MKVKIIAVALCFSIIAYAQKRDANWVFGMNAGIDFTNPETPISFYSGSNSTELAANVSDQSGNLMMFLKCTDLSSSPQIFNIVDADNNLLPGGNSVRANHSSTNGAIFLPYPYETTDSRDGYHLFTIDEYFSNCDAYFCTRLYYSRIEPDSSSVFIVTKKHHVLINDNIGEKLAAVKHANGRDWWLITHQHYYYHPTNVCTDSYIKLLLSDDSVKAILYQNIGTIRCGLNDGVGEMIFSKNGNLLADVVFEQNKVDVYSFDRCTGNLILITTIQNVIKPYGLEFSTTGRFLYVSSGFPMSTGPSYLYQIDLHAQPVINTVIYQHPIGPYLGQLQRAPDDKIYAAWASGSVDTSGDISVRYLGVINYPDSFSVACDFQKKAFFLGDSAYTQFGLPNMPNYNLGALSIYEADAGGDKLWCVGDTMLKGFFLGVPQVPGVQYSWHPADSLSDTTAARPFANPVQTTMYVVTLTDTSIKYSCQSRTDTVWVMVKDCTVGLADEARQPLIGVFPNPADKILHVSISKTLYFKVIRLTDLSGKTILETTETTIPLHSISKGLYFVSVLFANGQRAVSKVVVE